MRTTNPNLEFPKATFKEPTPYGYIYAGMIVDPSGRAPLVRGSSKRNDALARSKTVARRLEELDEVIKATVYRAVLIPPIEGMPRFDVIVLVQTTSPETISEVQTSEPYERLDADFVMAARNTRRIGDTEVPLSGSFLFNHFTAEDPEGAVEVWESFTGWYTAKIGVDNSTLLQPIGEAPYAFINYVRLPRGPIRFMLDQVVRPSFYSFVRSNLSENGMGALPLFCEPI